jgi:putative hydrolase of HD superfamily
LRKNIKFKEVDFMNHRTYIDFLNKIEKLKCNTRHSWTSSGRQESVAEHSWRLAVMAILCTDEYPELDINKVIKMCLIHDFGEAITGDIPAFLKTAQNEIDEDRAVIKLLLELPADFRTELQALFDEMNARETPEAKFFKSLDNLEALISHNEADISTWLPREYEENLTYGQINCEWSEWTKELRNEIKNNSIEKIEKAKLK